MNTDKEIFDYCNRAIFYDYNSIECTVELNKIRKYIINRFYESIPNS